MLLTKFWQIIDASAIGRFVEKKQQEIFKTDPERIYVENVRSFFGMPYWAAKFFCEMAVRQGIFVKRIGLICLNTDCERLIAQYEKKSDIPEGINCLNCEINEKEHHQFKSADLKEVVFYKLNKQTNNGQG